MTDIVERLRAGEPCGTVAHPDVCEVMTAASGCTCAQAADEIARLKAEMVALHADAATVVRALDAAIQLTEALISFLPEGAPLHPCVETAHATLEAAMAALRRPCPHADIDRLRQALRIAGHNIAALTDHRERLTRALNSGLVLIDAMLREVARLPNLPMTLVVARNAFDDSMKKLFAEQS